MSKAVLQNHNRKNAENGTFPPSTTLDRAELSRELNTEFIGKTLFVFDEIDSTNTKAKQDFQSPDGSVFIAEHQSAGKGRLGREWDSEKGCGIYMSVLLKPNIPPENAPLITLIAGLSVCRILRTRNFDAAIKWPNDIVINGKKVCGILTEMSAEKDKINYIVCGIGVNVNNPDFDDVLKVKATSLFIESNTVQCRENIFREILREFEKYYMLFSENGIEPFLSEYKKHCITLNKQISITSENQILHAVAVDIDTDGALIAECDGEYRKISAGEVSVRGIYGYV